MNDGCPIVQLCGGVLFHDSTFTLEELINGEVEYEIYGHVCILMGCFWDDDIGEYLYIVIDPIKDFGFNGVLFLTYEELKVQTRPGDP